jgi:hypothetical protein
MRTETPTIDVFEIARQKFFSSGDEAARRFNERQDCSKAQSCCEGHAQSLSVLGKTGRVRNPRNEY